MYTSTPPPSSVPTKPTHGPWLVKTLSTKALMEAGIARASSVNMNAQAITPASTRHEPESKAPNSTNNPGRLPPG